MKTRNKQDLADWIVEQYSDCGRTNYFSSDLRANTPDEYLEKWLIKNKTKSDLIEDINNHSEEGQKYLEENNLLK